MLHLDALRCTDTCTCYCPRRGEQWRTTHTFPPAEITNQPTRSPRPMLNPVAWVQGIAQIDCEIGRNRPVGNGSVFYGLRLPVSRVQFRGFLQTCKTVSGESQNGKLLTGRQGFSADLQRQQCGTSPLCRRISQSCSCDPISMGRQQPGSLASAGCLTGGYHPVGT